MNVIPPALRRLSRRSTRARVTTVAAIAGLVVLASAVPTTAQGTGDSPQQLAGIESFRQVSPLVTLSSAVPPAAIPALAARGVKTLLVVRAPGEKGYDAAATEAAATAAGLTWVAEPFNADAPDMAVVDRVLAQLARPDAGATVIACRTGQRAALMWYARRVLVDHWDDTRAMDEATGLGLVRDDLKTFARAYVQARAPKAP